MLANVTLPHTFSNGTTADAQQVDDNFTAITAQVNGNLDDTNIKPGALTGASLAAEAVKPSNSEGIAYALHVFGGSFVFSGARASKDGTTANKLDVTAGVIFMKQADGSLRVLQPASNSFTTSVASTTYYLDFNPDASWWWNTAHSTTSGYLSVASVTTDGSGNISAVTQTTASDNPNLFNGMVGTPMIANSSYLRTDSNAPNPQTVANPVNFSATPTFPSWYMGNGLGTGKQTQFGTTVNTVSGVNPDLFAIAEEGVAWVFGLDHSGNLGVSGSASAEGHKLIESVSGGYKVESGTFTTTSSAGTETNTTVTFPTAFSSAPIVVVTPTTSSSTTIPQFNNTTVYPYALYNVTTSGFTFVANQTVANTYHWVAIGS